MVFFKLLRQSPWSARVGLAMVLLNVFAALFAPYIAPYSETEIVGDVWLPMSTDHLLGTDHLGRDLFTRLLYGARNTIAIAFVTTLLSFVVGTILGFFAATLGGWTDLTLSRLIDILMAFPTLIFALIALSVVGTRLHPGVSPIPGRGHGHCRHGVRRSSPTARRENLVAHAPGSSAQCHAAAGGGIRPAFLFRIFVHRRFKLPGSGDPAPHGGLGRYGAGECRRNHLRHFYPAMAGGGHRIFDRRREFNCRLVSAHRQRTEGLVNDERRMANDKLSNSIHNSSFDHRHYSFK